MNELKKFCCGDLRSFNKISIISFAAWLLFWGIAGIRSVSVFCGLIVLFAAVWLPIWYFTCGAAVVRFSARIRDIEKANRTAELLHDFENGELTLCESLIVGKHFLIGKGNGYVVELGDISMFSYIAREPDKNDNDNPDYGCSLLRAEVKGKTIKLVDLPSDHACDIQWNILKEKLIKAHPEIKMK